MIPLALAKPTGVRILLPCTSASPAVVGSSPIRQLMVVDLPAPFGPNRQKHSPAAQARDAIKMFWRASLKHSTGA